MKALAALHQLVEDCSKCSRLRKHCHEISKTKRRAYREETYWGKPISGFGVSEAQLWVIGLAPGAHGANRTGRIFTGDRSGDWLFRALFKAGFASQANSSGRGDGLELQNTYISCIVRCAPPDNKPKPLEIKRCQTHLKTELMLLKGVKVFIALGHLAYREVWSLLKLPGSQPSFRHGLEIEVPDGRLLLASYHPSQQNTFTGRLTEKMFDQIFLEAKRAIDKSDSSDTFLASKIV